MTYIPLNNLGLALEINEGDGLVALIGTASYNDGAVFVLEPVDATNQQATTQAVINALKNLSVEVIRALRAHYYTSAVGGGE